MTPPSGSPYRRAWVWLALALLSAGLGWGWFRFGRFSAPSPVTRLVLALDRAAWSGINPAQQRGITILLKDQFELASPFPVLLEESLRGLPPADTTYLYLGGRRVSDQLELTCRMEGPAGKAVFTLPKANPGSLLTGVVAQVANEPRAPERLVPKLAEPFWELAELTGWTGDQEVEPFRERARALVQRTPECPSAWLVLAELDWRVLILTSASDPETQDLCRSRFRKALELLPSYPRAAYNESVMNTDTGNQREAIEALLKAIQAHPHVPSLRHGLAYSARTVGLLEGSRRALLARDRLQGPSRAGRKVAENTYLYLGDWDKFEESLGSGPDPFVDEVVDFYRGYLRLLRGDRDRARTWFERVCAHPGTKTDFEALAKVYLLSLQNRPAEARSRLDALQQQRLRLRVPDGEFTFKLAEAYALLGDADQALLMAERSYGQGFACTTWFEASPLLAKVRATPRWRPLQQHLKERQQFLEQRFPPAAFD